MGLRLRALREKRGLSVRGLAKMAGVQFSTVHRIETGKMSPRLVTLTKLAKALGVSVSDLVKNRE